MTDVLSRRRLNRALLARQLLLRRHPLSALAALERVAGVQHQEPDLGYFALWSRLEGFHQRELTGLLEDRRAVRGTVMRGTQHIVSAADFVALRPVVQPLLDRVQRGAFGAATAGVDPGELVAVARAALAERPLRGDEGRALLAARWPDHDPTALWYSVQYLVPLVTIPPGATWGVRGRLTSAAAETWLGRPLARDDAPDELLVRYLAAFGPASVKDAQAWSGVTRLRAAAERLGDRVRTFRDDDGRELLDLPAAPRPDPETPAPVRFLPGFDNAVQAYADRTRILPEAHREIVVAGIATVLVDGEVRGSWTIARDGGTAVLHVRTFAPLAAADRDALAGEGERLLAFAAPGARHDLRLEVGTSYLR